MYNDLILMVHNLVAPLQYQTADQHHVISWHHQCKSCHWPDILDRWCNQCHWCAHGKKLGRSQLRYCHHFSASCNQCAITTWSWPSCCEVEYDRYLLHLPRGIWTYSYWDGDDAKDENTCSLWWFSIDKSEIQDMAAPKDVDWHGDLTDQFKLHPPVDYNGQEIDMSAFPIEWPHPDDLHLVCHLIECSLLSHIDCVIDHHKHLFVTHNIAHLICKGHLDDISALLLFHHLKLATLKEDDIELI